MSSSYLSNTVLNLYLECPGIELASTITDFHINFCLKWGNNFKCLISRHITDSFSNKNGRFSYSKSKAIKDKSREKAS